MSRQNILFCSRISVAAISILLLTTFTLMPKQAFAQSFDSNSSINDDSFSLDSVFSFGSNVDSDTGDGTGGDSDLDAFLFTGMLAGVVDYAVTNHSGGGGGGGGTSGGGGSSPLAGAAPESGTGAIFAGLLLAGAVFFGYRNLTAARSKP